MRAVTGSHPTIKDAGSFTVGPNTGPDIDRDPAKPGEAEEPSAIVSVKTLRALVSVILDSGVSTVASLASRRVQPLDAAIEEATAAIDSWATL